MVLALLASSVSAPNAARGCMGSGSEGNLRRRRDGPSPTPIIARSSPVEKAGTVSRRLQFPPMRVPACRETQQTSRFPS